MKVDNFKQIREMLNFESGDEFYFIEIMQRKKDGNMLRDCNNVIIKDYFIKSLKHFDIVTPEMITLCDVFNARAYIRLNKRSFKKCALRMIGDVAVNIETENYMGCRKSFASVAGKYNADKNKTWVIDIDDEATLNSDNSVDYKKQLYNILNISDALSNTSPIIEGASKWIAILNTPNGKHYITRPFDLQTFKRNWLIDYNEEFPYSIHKDNPTLLYYKGE